jgi:hypothetical protein
MLDLTRRAFLYKRRPPGARCEPGGMGLSEAMVVPAALLAAGAGHARAVDQALDLGQRHSQLGDVVAGHALAVLDEDLVADALDRQRVHLGAVVLAVATLPALAVGDHLFPRHGDLVTFDDDREGLRQNGRLGATGAGMLLHGSSP